MIGSGARVFMLVGGTLVCNPNCSQQSPNKAGLWLGLLGRIDNLYGSECRFHWVLLRYSTHPNYILTYLS